MLIMPHIKATGVLVHTPVTHGHIVSIVATPSRKTTEEEVLELFKAHPRIRVVRIADGFLGNASLFKYARDLGNLRGDMYEIAVFEETVKVFEDQIIYTINIPQEAVVTPETMDAIRAAMEMQIDRLEAVSLTNKYLKLGG
jgi:glyceraldehyde-3-phosphate dehydrogenase (NAD(P))